MAKSVIAVTLVALAGAVPYTMLVSMANNHYLPYAINQGACELLRVLYLDRYPQVTKQPRFSLGFMVA